MIWLVFAIKSDYRSLKDFDVIKVGDKHIITTTINGIKFSATCSDLENIVFTSEQKLDDITQAISITNTVERATDKVYIKKFRYKSKEKDRKYLKDYFIRTGIGNSLLYEFYDYGISFYIEYPGKLVIMVDNLPIDRARNLLITILQHFEMEGGSNES